MPELAIQGEKVSYLPTVATSYRVPNYAINLNHVVMQDDDQRQVGRPQISDCLRFAGHGLTGTSHKHNYIQP